jgi:hypothetical protein
MTLRNAGGTLHLEGACPVEAAEEVMQVLSDGGIEAVDLHDCTHLHTAVLQVLLHARLPILRLPAGPLLQAWLAPLAAAPHPAPSLEAQP